MLEHILVADVGGTNARFALAASPQVGRNELSQSLSLPTRDYSGLVPAVNAYLDQISGLKPTRACIAVACPVWADNVCLTNNHWSFSVLDVRRTLGLEHLLVVNDFKALAAGVPYLDVDERVQIGAGLPVAGRPLSVIGPGTGLGVATIACHGSGHLVVDGEGGHVGFAPGNEREMEILRLLGRRYGRVSTERILSGEGLGVLHKALAEIDSVRVDDFDARDIVGKANAGTCQRCLDSIEIFCSILGSFAGDTALTMSSQGGVYIGGGIVPRIAKLLEKSPFRQRFEDKGRMVDFIKDVPTYLITTDHAALAGAASLLRADT